MSASSSPAASAFHNTEPLLHGYAFEDSIERSALPPIRARSVDDVLAQSAFEALLSFPPHIDTSTMARTFDQLTPEELCRIGGYIEMEVLSSATPSSSSPFAFGPLPSVADAFSASVAVGVMTPPKMTTTTTLPLSRDGFACRWSACTRHFATIDTLVAHIQNTHVPRRQARYPCMWRGCPRDPSNPLTKRHKLITHLRSHTMERPFACHQCGRSFSREDSRDQHVKVHGEERQGPWGCACHGGRVWRSWRGVRRHEAGNTCRGVWRVDDAAAAANAGLTSEQYRRLVDQANAAVGDVGAIGDEAGVSPF